MIAELCLTGALVCGLLAALLADGGLSRSVEPRVLPKNRRVRWD